MKTSEQIDQLATALAIVQGVLQTVSKDGKANYGKYAKLEDIITTASPILSANGLSVIQMPIIVSDTRIGMVTRIMHKSGQWVESEPISSKLDRDNAQGVGSCISYLRRYQINAMLFLGAADDDGNAACGKDVSTGKSLDKPKIEAAPAAAVFDILNPKHLKRLEDLIEAENITLDCDTVIRKMEGLPLTKIKDAVLALKQSL